MADGDTSNIYQMDGDAAQAWIHRMVDEAFEEGAKLGVALNVIEDTDPRKMQLLLEWFDIAGQQALEETDN